MIKYLSILWEVELGSCVGPKVVFERKGHWPVQESTIA